MRDVERFKLLYGPYAMPRCTVGGWLTCRLRGRVKVRGLSDTPIPWPFTIRPGGGRPLFILCSDLVRAVQRESATAVAHAWGVSLQTVSKWRKALGVEPITPGTSALFRRWAPETLGDEETTRKRMESLKAPERAAKIAAAKRGKPRPESVKQALRDAHTGRKASAETRRRMSEAHKERWKVNPHFKPEEDALLGTMLDREIAERIGRPVKTVLKRRLKLGIAAFIRRRPAGKPVTWTAAKDAMLGTMPDSVLARKLGCSPMTVFYRRRRLKVPPFRR